MAQRHEAWVATTETKAPIGEMPEPTIPALSRIIDRVQQRSGIVWEEGGGHGGFNGLDEAFAAAVSPRLAHCGGRCVMRATLGGIEAGQVLEGSDLQLTCPGLEYASQAAAEAAEDRCHDNQLKVVAEFPGWVQSVDEERTAAEAGLETARQRVEEAF